VRSDALGIFWRDQPVVKAAKAEKPKCTPPEPTWLSPDYLPGLEEALAFDVPRMTDLELADVWRSSLANDKRSEMIYDTEVYPNYFLAAFKCKTTGKIVYFERHEETDVFINTAKMEWIIRNFCIVSFNGIIFDMPITALALAGKTNLDLVQATNEIIVEQLRGTDVLKRRKVKALKGIDHIDLIEVPPLSASLKLYSGRMHCKRMQDLPFPPGTWLSPEQIAIVRWYCLNDLDNTEALREELKEQITLREEMSKEYGVDLRSKSDAQIAEAVLSEAVGKLNGLRPQRPQIDIGTRYKYKIPHFLKYNTELMNWVLDVVRHADFVVSDDGAVGMPPELSGLKVPIAGSTYVMGIGGLHSSEKSAKHRATGGYVLKDIDVESYYPKIILNQNLFPVHLGYNFLKAYAEIVSKRLHAKHEAKACKQRGDKAGEKFWKVIADSLKITINGSFGKLGSPYSVLYSPDLLIQVTVTGQLALLMLIERLELCGLNVVSANTDGIVVKVHADREHEVDAIVRQWEKDTDFVTEETKYTGLFSRDVNNYIALKPDGTFKVKGAYSEKGSNGNSRLSKNPAGLICSDAVVEFLRAGTPIETTIMACKDIKRFVHVRTVKGGGVKNGEFLGKTIRWYYGQGDEDVIIYASSGKKVPKSDGAVPLMTLPKEIPSNINYDVYIAESHKILEKELKYFD
jgi:hypothetical protein